MKSAMRFKKTKVEQAIREALAGLPPILRQKMENVEIILEDWPAAEIRKEMGLKSRYDLLGLYQGVPRPEREFHSPALLPDTITIFQGPIEDLCRNERDLSREIRAVLYHEIGHFYGFSESDLAELEEGLS